MQLLVAAPSDGPANDRNSPKYKSGWSSSKLALTKKQKQTYEMLWRASTESSSISDKDATWRTEDDPLDLQLESASFFYNVHMRQFLLENSCWLNSFKVQSFLPYSS